jgi:hypothetical protein
MFGDGRRMNKSWGKLFSYCPRGRRHELPLEKRSELARLFRLGVPAARVAEDPGIHRNTA